MKHQTVKYGRRGGEEVIITKDFTPTEEGALAIDLLHHFAIIAAKEDGEDTAGRQKLKLQSADEIVQRSCDIAAAMIAEMRKRSWILDLPTPKPPDAEGMMDEIAGAIPRQVRKTSQEPPSQQEPEPPKF